MAEEVKTIVSSPSDYWISPNALSISLNALGEHDRIQASVSSGAVIFCYIKDIAAFDFDAGHNFRKWPLVISPTYFNSTTEKYLYVAIPRSNTIGSEAMIVFPSQLLDIYGRAAVKRIVRDEQGNMLDPDGNITTDESKADYYYIAGDQVGSEDYYYIWLHGIITASGDNSANEREWALDPKYDTGRLNTDETWGEVVTQEDMMTALRAKVNTDWFSRLFILHGYKMSVVYKTDPETGEPLIDEETGEPIVDIDEETGLPKKVKEDVVIQPNAWPQDGDGITITDIESKYGLWTNFFLSALGKNDAGGGGGGSDLFEPLLSINESGLGLPPLGLTGKVGIVWNYATQQYEWGETGGGGGGEGSVTSIGLTAPTGFTVTGSPITSSGTLGLAFADGYSLPTTAKQTLWDEAYNKRHEHSNLNVLEGITSVYTKEQADAKFMTIAAFERLFNPLDSSDQKVSHPYSSGVAGIKALFGLWTEQYLSALGKNDSGGGSGGGSSTLAGLNDVQLGTLNANDVLTYDGNGHWVNTPKSTFLSGYATQAWVGQQNYLTTETDPTVPAWAKAPTKPSYSFSELTSHPTTLSDYGITDAVNISTTWWGQSISNGTVTGNLSSVESITMSESIVGLKSLEFNTRGELQGYGGFLDFHYNGSLADFTSRIIEETSGVLSIQAGSLVNSEFVGAAAALVVGIGYNGSSITIGNGKLVWDETNNSLKVIRSNGSAANIYATGGVSALGMQAGVSVLDAMTFNYVTINNNLEFGAASRITHAVTEDDISLFIGNVDNSGWVALADMCSQDGSSYWSITSNGIAVFNNKVQSPKFYLDGSRYLYLDGNNNLMFYNGTTAKQVAFVN